MGTTRRKSGVLTAEVEPYRQWLLEQGFTPATVRLLLRNLSQLGVWLQERGLAGSAIPRAYLDELFGERRALGRRGVPGRLGSRRLLVLRTTAACWQRRRKRADGARTAGCGVPQLATPGAQDLRRPVRGSSPSSRPGSAGWMRVAPSARGSRSNARNTPVSSVARSP